MLFIARKLLTQTQLGDQRNVTVVVFAVQIGQQALTAVDHAQQTTTTVVVFGVQLEMGGEFVDTGGQQSHLDFGTTGCKYYLLYLRYLRQPMEWRLTCAVQHAQPFDYSVKVTTLRRHFLRCASF
jgi:hypothetical protein